LYRNLKRPLAPTMKSGTAMAMGTQGAGTGPRDVDCRDCAAPQLLLTRSTSHMSKG
jgi:hypothetical protein